MYDAAHFDPNPVLNERRLGHVGDTRMSSHHINPHSRLSAAARLLIERIHRAGRPPMEAMTPAQARAFYDIGGPILDLQPPPQVDRVEELQIPVRDGHACPARLYAPHSQAPLPVLLYLHGGGFKIGNQWANDRQMREIAAAWGGVVISADYLHTPEHVFPGAVEEVSAVLHWLHECGAASGLDTENIAFGGVSAGACIGFGAAMGLGKPSWLKAAVAVVGAFSFDTTSASMQAFGNVGLFPQLPLVQPMFEAYVPNPSERTDPRAAPGEEQLG